MSPREEEGRAGRSGRGGQERGGKEHDKEEEEGEVHQKTERTKEGERKKTKMRHGVAEFQGKERGRGDSRKAGRLEEGKGRERGGTERRRGIPTTHRLVLRSAFSILSQNWGQSVPCPLEWIGGQMHVSMIEQVDGWMGEWKDKWMCSWVGR